MRKSEEYPGVPGLSTLDQPSPLEVQMGGLGKADRGDTGITQASSLDIERGHSKREGERQSYDNDAEDQNTGKKLDLISETDTANNVGIDKRNEILAAFTLSNLRNRAAVIAIPDRLTPGINEKI